MFKLILLGAIIALGWSMYSIYKSVVQYHRKRRELQEARTESELSGLDVTIAEEKLRKKDIDRQVSKLHRRIDK